MFAELMTHYPLFKVKPQSSESSSDGCGCISTFVCCVYIKHLFISLSARLQWWAVPDTNGMTNDDFSTQAFVTVLSWREPFPWVVMMR